MRPAHTVLDSPAKTPAELREALAIGIAVNADNPQELARLDALVRSAPTASPLGLRVNPQTGAGSIGALSTATATSKFGVALRDEGAREWVVRAFLDRPWLNRLHTHSGSQGVPLELMAEGVRAVHELAEEINAAAGRQQIDTIDIGGGLPVNFSSDGETPTYAEYARLLKATAPGLLDGRYGLVTEFGRSLLAKHGTILARVEYAKSAGGRAIAVTHAGVQVATRTVYAPASWPLRIAAYDGEGRPSTAPSPLRTSRAPPASRATCWRRTGSCRCSGRGTTWRCWTPGRTTSRTTTRTTALPGPRFTGSRRGRPRPRPARGVSGSRRCGTRRAWRRSSPSRAGRTRTRCSDTHRPKARAQPERRP